MRYCPSCGEEVRDDSMGFCTVCGAYFSKPVAPGPVAIPDDPVEAGMVMMDQGRFDEGVRRWISALESGAEIDDVTYRRMVDSAAGCMLSTVVQAETYARASVPAMAVSMPGRTFVRDLMAKLVDNLGICTIQNGVLGLANSYFLLFLDVFAVTTDLRELHAACHRACDDVGAMIDRASGLPDAIQAKGPAPMDWLDSYWEFAAVMGDAIAGMMSTASEDRMNELAAGWAVKGPAEYCALVGSAFSFNMHATPAGWLSRRIILKSRDAQVANFAKCYMKG